jgi:hypothetical protein
MVGVIGIRLVAVKRFVSNLQFFTLVRTFPITGAEKFRQLLSILITGLVII